MKLEEYSALFEKSRDIVLFVHLDGRLLEANRVAEQAYGYTREELLRLSVFDIRRDDSQPRRQMGAASTEGLVFETVHYRKDGSSFPVEVSSSGAEVDGERILISMVRDIGRRKQMERLVWESEERYRQLFNAMNEGVVIHDMVFNGEGRPVDYRIVDVNPKYESIMGIPAQQARGRLGSEIYESAEAPFLESYADVVQTGKPHTFQSYFAPRQKYLEISVFSHQKNGFVSVFRDVTENVLAQEEIRKSNLRNESLVKVFSFRDSTEKELLDYALNEAVRLTASRYGFLFLYDEERGVFSAGAWSGSVEEDCGVKTAIRNKFRIDGTSLWAEAARAGKPVILNDFRARARGSGFPDGHIPIDTFLSIPLMDDDSFVALLGLANNPRGYEQLDVWQATILMESALEIVKRKRTEQRLANESERLTTTISALSEAVIAVDMGGVIQTLNRAAGQLTGWTESEAVGRKIGDVLELRDEGTGLPMEDAVEAVSSGSAGFLSLADKVLVSRDGKEYRVKGGVNPVRGKDDHLLGIVYAFDDITAEKEKQKEIAYLSYHDSLTGLYNRRFFEEELKRLDAERNYPISIIMGDVNGLKLANDVFGHLVGDELLRRAADTMREVCRADDIIARWGGDEFILLLPRTEQDDARRICGRIKTLSSERTVGILKLSISLGYAVKRSAAQQPEAVMSAAEDMMYRHKTNEATGNQGRMTDSILQSLFKKSWVEEQHSRHVGFLCGKIGAAMGLPRERLAELEQVSRLHDIGKIVISDKTLNKKGALTPDEWKEMRQHPEVGYRIIKSNRDLAWMADYVLYHHERFDGSGYPSGLKNRDIPLIAKILAVADAYDAMVCGRYRSATLTRDQAAGELHANADRQFDAEVVRVFLEDVYPALGDEPALPS